MRSHASLLAPTLIATLLAVPNTSEAQSPPSNIQFGVGGNVVIEPGNSLVNGLGGTAGFGEYGVAKADDGFEHIDVSAVFDSGLSYFGIVYDGATDFYVGRNGYVTLGVGSGSFTPWGIAGSNIPIIAPFFSDVDTRGVPGAFDAAGNSTGTNRIWVDVDPVADVVTITFDDVGEYNNITTHLNAYQIRLWDLGGGDFGIEYRYEWMEWADHSGWATAGWSAGDSVNFYELPASGNAGMLNLETSTNIGQSGIWFWQVTGGSVGAYQASVTENSAAGTVVGPLRVDDTDLGDSHTFTLLNDDGGRFVIVDVGGIYEVRVTPGAVLDYETAATRTIRVRATDGFGLTHEQDVSIPVDDVNEAPTGLGLSATTIDENSAVGATVGTLSASDPDAGDSHTFSIVTPGTPFTIVGGQLRTASPLDHEAQASWAVTIRATDSGGLTRDEPFTVQVADLNEAPATPALSNSTVPESAAVGAVVGTLSSSDPDAGDSVAFSLVGAASPFNVVGNELRVAGGLDFETTSSFDITLRATDNGGLTADRIVTILITDVNEAPTNVLLSGATVAEDASVGAVVGVLSSVDVDAGDTHSYAITSGGAGFAIVGNELRVAASLDHETAATSALTIRTTDATGATFARAFTITITDTNEAPSAVSLSASTVVENAAAGTPVGTLSANDPDVGDTHTFSILTPGTPFTIVGSELRVAGAIDFESSASHALTIRATDSGGLTRDLAVTISATDVNEAPTAVALSANTIDERSTIGTPVGTLSTTDPDAGDSHTLVLVSACPFRIQGGALVVDRVIDYEAATSHVCSVRATDAGGLQHVEDLTVVVNDVNDPPTAVALSSDTVAENSAAGTIVGTLSTTDQDVGDVFTYAVLTSGAPFGAVGATLQVTAAIDYEAQTSWVLTIRTTDSGGLTRDETFTVQVSDVNEAPSAPVLSGATVPENAAVGTLVGSLSSSDPDAGDSVVFSLVGAAAPFSIVGDELRVAGALDFETTASYDITVRASDTGGLTADRVVTVQVTDTNDAPTDLLLSGATVPENSAAGTVVGSLSSVDVDAGDSHTYSIVSGGADFVVAGNELRLAAMQDYEVAATRAVSIRTTDSGGASFDRAFTITIVDVNEAPTAIAISSASISENAALTTQVGTLSATDPDAGDSHTFSLLTGGVPFAVASTGALTVSGSLDHEAAPDHTFSVRVTDAGGLVYDQSFTVTVLDLPEAPTSVTLSHSVVAENSPFGTTIGALTAADPDVGDTHTFSVVTPSVPFAVVGDALRVSGPLDYEQQAQFALTLRATDSAGLTRDVNVTIDVTDVNEAPTDLVLTGSSVSEDASVGAVVGTLTSSDPDSGDSGTFGLVTTGQAFIVVGDELRVAGALDFETQTTHALTIRVTDGAGLTFDRVFVIDVIDANDAPEDVLLSSTNVAENAPIGAVVGLLNAIDQDIGDLHTFALQTSGVPFAVIGDELRVAGALDFESTATYAIWIRATDAGGLVYDAAFTIVVDDVNDAPTGITFVSAPIPEDAAPGATVGALSVTDVDAGDSHTFSIVGPSAFAVVGTEVHVAAPLDFEAAPTHAITLRVTDAGGLTFDQGFTITITNVNEAPTAVAFTGDVVAENAPVGTLVGTFSTTDPDVPDAHVYSLVGSAGPFVVDGEDLLVSGAIDFEQTASLEIVVRTTDANGLFFERAFTVDVDNLNDNAPTVAPQSFTVSESAVSGTFVGRVVAVDADGDPLDFTMVSNDAFTVASNGDLIVVRSGALDYEVQQNHALEVGVSDGTFTTTVAIDVALLDENDTRPSFDDVHWIVTETATPGFVVGTLESEDPDGTPSFAITAGNDEGIFAVDSSSGQVSVADPTALDFETTRRHRLQVTVDDGEQSTHATAFIAVRNENDNAPILSAQTLSVRADALPGDVVGRVAVDDLDGDPLVFSLVGSTGALGIDREQGELVVLRPELLAGQSVTLRVVVDDGIHRVEKTVRVNHTPVGRSAPVIEDQVFEVLENAGAEEIVGRVEVMDPQGDPVRLQIVAGDPQRRFSLDPVTGALSLAAPLPGPQRLTVRASDGLSTRDATVVVRIVEENDSAPRIDPQVLSVAPDALPGDAIGPVVATDADHDVLTYAIVAGDALSAFEIDAAGLLSLAPGALVTDLLPSQALTIAVGDGVHTATAAVTIRVTAFGTNTPVLASRSYMIAEDAPQHTVMGVVEATDADGDVVSYALLAGGEDGLFTIDAATGALRLSDATRLDYESRAAYTLLVSATDGWNVAVAEMHIDVLDVNDEPPHFASQLFSVSELALDGAEVGFVSATDPEGTGLELRFTDAVGAPFALDTETGRLTVAEASQLDYEQRVGYVLEVAADDGRFTEHAFVTVRIAPENDNIPVVAPLVVEVPEDAAPGTVIGTMTGTDPDGEVLTWIIADGNEAAPLFALNATGDLALAKPLDFETAQEHSLVVQASDGANVANTTATVRVVNVNDVAPRLEDVVVEIASSTEVGSEIGVVEAFDADGDALAFRLDDDTGPISLDATTGVLRLEAPLSSDITLAVTVDDGRFTASARIVIRLDDDGAVPPDANVLTTTGCSCDTSRERGGGEAWSVLALACLAGLSRCRRRRRRGVSTVDRDA